MTQENSEGKRKSNRQNGSRLGQWLVPPSPLHPAVDWEVDLVDDINTLPVHWTLAGFGELQQETGGKKSEVREFSLLPCFLCGHFN